MNGVGKIESFFNQEGWKLKQNCCQSRKHIGGKSFYNDGACLVDNYKAKINGKDFELNVKLTGRPIYWIVSNSKEIVIAFSQAGLLDYLKSNRDIYGDKIY